MRKTTVPKPAHSRQQLTSSTNCLTLSSVHMHAASRAADLDHCGGVDPRSSEPGQPIEPAPRTSELDTRIDAVRRFNRLYTRRIGVLQHGYLRSSFSLAEVRVLYELAHRQPTTATELARALDLDAGYLSRILASFTRHGMLHRARSDRDGREQLLSLTRHGQDTFAPLETAAREQIGALLEQLPERQQQRLVAAMHAIGGLLGEVDAEPD